MNPSWTPIALAVGSLIGLAIAWKNIQRLGSALSVIGDWILIWVFAMIVVEVAATVAVNFGIAPDLMTDVAYVAGISAVIATLVAALIVIKAWRRGINSSTHRQ